MAHTKLLNYLRSHRKRAGLSQADVAFLLGGDSGAHVSRYERFHRTPSLLTALAYEAIFDTAVSELLAGEYQRIERQVMGRAQTLLRRMRKQPTDRATSRKLTFLQVIAQPLAAKKP